MANQGRVETLVLDSEVLADNPLDDPARREIPVYLPPSYATGGGPYPVLYVLVGYSGSGTMLLNREAWGESLDRRMDRLIAGGLPEAIVVMPDCFTRYGGSQYMNSTAHGRYEDHLLTEILPEVDRRFRTRGGREGRGVVGKSSGGYGALRMGLLHADQFAAVACHSGDCYFEYCYQPEFPRFLDAIHRAGGLEAFLAGFFARPKHGAEDFSAICTLAMAAAYSPDPRVSPLGIDLPFDLTTGELRAEVWRRWKEQDPVEMVERCAEALRSLELLYLDCGTRDEYHLHYGARIFARRCRERGIAVEHEEFDDDHRGLSYRYDVSFPRLLGALTR
jgi:enterochelin esterase family protein